MRRSKEEKINVVDASLKTQTVSNFSEKTKLTALLLNSRKLHECQRKSVVDMRGKER